MERLNDKGCSSWSPAEGSRPRTQELAIKEMERSSFPPPLKGKRRKSPETTCRCATQEENCQVEELSLGNRTARDSLRTKKAELSTIAGHWPAQAHGAHSECQLWGRSQAGG